jgi:phage-related protein
VRPIEFIGTSLDDLRSFPPSARREAGHQLDRVQHDLEPSDWKSMRSIGAGAREIRVRVSAGAFRVIYVVKIKGAVYVLQCFQKKTQKTSRHDRHIAMARYAELMRGFR